MSGRTDGTSLSNCFKTIEGRGEGKKEKRERKRALLIEDRNDLLCLCTVRRKKRKGGRDQHVNGVPARARPQSTQSLSKRFEREGERKKRKALRARATLFYS